MSHHWIQYHIVYGGTCPNAAFISCKFGIKTHMSCVPWRRRVRRARDRCMRRWPGRWRPPSKSGKGITILYKPCILSNWQQTSTKILKKVAHVLHRIEYDCSFTAAGLHSFQRHFVCLTLRLRLMIPACVCVTNLVLLKRMLNCLSSDSRSMSSLSSWSWPACCVQSGAETFLLSFQRDVSQSSVKYFPGSNWF